MTKIKELGQKNNVMTMIMIVMVIIINNNYHNGNKMMAVIIIPINRIINNDSYSINNYVHDNN